MLKLNQLAAERDNTGSRILITPSPATMAPQQPAVTGSFSVPAPVTDDVWTRSA